MKKVSTAAGKTTENFRDQKLTIGLDLGDRWSWYCLLDEVGEVLLEQKLSTTPKAMREVFGAIPRCRIALEDVATTQAHYLMLKSRKEGSAAMKRLGRIVRQKFDRQARRKRSQPHKH
jgi:hypothetical protein